MRTFLILWTITVPLFTMGCAFSNSAADKYQYQPIARFDREVHGTSVSKPTGLVDVGTTLYRANLVWKAGLKSYNSNRIIEKCDSFLEANEVSYLTHRIHLDVTELPDNAQYPWLDYRNNIYSERDGKITLRKLGYRHIKTIICIDPVIVICTSGSILYTGYSMPLDPDHKWFQYESGASNGGCWGNELSDNIMLKNGYAYGTRIPYAENPQWFSPDMNVLPRKVEMDENNVGHIPVPWGELLMTKQGDDWVVSAKD
jgi:hypothetical protein